MKLVRSLIRRLSYANIVASAALFVALGGGAYAATKINGNSIKVQSIGGGKLKNETITSKQIKKGSLNSSVIDVSTLPTVPSATSATTAQSATKATTAASATRATSAETADRATSAEVAESAKSAQTADSATTAASATRATEADRAKTAGDAETVGGRSAADLTVGCPPATELFGGMCWDETERGPILWPGASTICAEAGGRLPSLSELIAYVSQGGIQAAGQNWSGDAAEIEGGEPRILTSDETKRESRGAEKVGLGFRCLFYRVN